MILVESSWRQTNVDNEFFIMKNTHVFLLSLILFLAGGLIFIYKWQVTGLPLSPGLKAPAWEIEKKLVFDTSGKPVKLTFHVPSDRGKKAIIRERVLAPSFGIYRNNEENRKVVLTKRKPSGKQLVFSRIMVHAYHSKQAETKVERPEVKQPALTEAQTTVAQALVNVAEAKSVDETSFIMALLRALKTRESSEHLTEFTAGRSKDAVLIDAAVKILNWKNMPARRVNGLNLANQLRPIVFIHWLEVFIEGNWVPFSVETVQQGVPSAYMPWWYGEKPFARLTGGTNLKSELSIVQIEQRILDRVLAAGRTERDGLVTFSLFGLPLATQDVYRILMVVPLGVFLMVLLRNVVGLTTLGTFMPVLIALAFRETQLVWGLTLLTIVVGSGLIFRFYLEHLKLLLVPRLAAVLIFVLLLMACISILTNALGFERGLSVALFPMVIMTMTVERVSVIWDERGPAQAIKEVTGSLLIAVLCYVLMTMPIIEHLFFTFPELVLLLLAATLLLGRYTGYRLLELKRFKVLAGD